MQQSIYIYIQLGKACGCLYNLAVKGNQLLGLIQSQVRHGAGTCTTDQRRKTSSLPVQIGRETTALLKIDFSAIQGLYQAGCKTSNLMPKAIHNQRYSTPFTTISSNIAVLPGHLPLRIAANASASLVELDTHFKRFAIGTRQLIYASLGNTTC